MRGSKRARRAKRGNPSRICSRRIDKRVRMGGRAELPAVSELEMLKGAAETFIAGVQHGPRGASSGHRKLAKPVPRPATTVRPCEGAENLVRSR